MPLDPGMWQTQLPDAAALARFILNLQPHPVPWANSSAVAHFRGEVAHAYGKLFTHCFNNDKTMFCERLAQFINFALLTDIADLKPRAFDTCTGI